MPDRPANCSWCHAETDGGLTATFDDGTTLAVCSDAHEAELRGAQRMLVKRLPLFFVGLLGGGGLALAGAVCPQHLVLVPAGLAVFGAAIALAPLVTPQTIQMLGFKRGLALGRAIGWVSVACGVAWAFSVLTS